MAAGHGEAGFLLDDGFDLEFVGGVDVAGVARHGECGHPILLDQAPHHGPHLIGSDGADFRAVDLHFRVENGDRSVENIRRIEESVRRHDD